MTPELQVQQALVGTSMHKVWIALLIGAPAAIFGVLWVSMRRSAARHREELAPPVKDFVRDDPGLIGRRWESPQLSRTHEYGPTHSLFIPVLSMACGAAAVAAGVVLWLTRR